MQPTLDATQHLPPLPSEPTADAPRVGFGASAFDTIAKLRARRARSATIHEAVHEQRNRTGMIIAGAIALVVAAVLLIIAINARNADDPGVSGQPLTQGAIESVELAGTATVETPGTAPNSRDWAGNTVTYGVDHLTDGDPTSAWRVGGDATSDELTIQWDNARTITELGLINGYAKVDQARENYDWYEINRRVLAVTWIFDDGTEVTQALDETPRMQTITLEKPIVTESLRLRLDEVSAPAGKDFTALSEITVRGE